MKLPRPPELPDSPAARAFVAGAALPAPPASPAPRARKQRARKEQISVALPAPLLAALDRESVRTGQSRAVLIANALSERYPV